MFCKVRPLLPGYVSKPGRPLKIPGPLQRLPKVIEGTTTNPAKGLSKEDRYVNKKVKHPTSSSVHDIILPSQPSK